MTGTPSRQGRITPLARTPTYEPPSLLVLGSVRDLTLGNVGSNLDNNGRAAHGKTKP